MNHTQERHLDRIEKSVREAASIGKTWARYGLGVSKSALLTSAETLQKVAGILDDLSGQFAERTPVQAQPASSDKPTETPAASQQASPPPDATVQ